MQPNPPSARKEELLSALRGQKVTIPSLHGAFTGWPRGVNIHYKEIVADVDDWLHSLLPESPKLPHLQKADFALFASTWWPEATADRLRILAYLSIWLFIWDDEIDESTGTLSHDFSEAQAFRDETVAFVTQSLALDETSARVSPPSPIIHRFEVIGEALRAAYSTAQRQVFMDEMLFFMKMSEVEQQTQLEHETPTIDQYWECRMGTSAVGVCLAVQEYSTGTYTEAPMRDSKELWDSANVIVSM